MSNLNVQFDKSEGRPEWVAEKLEPAQARRSPSYLLPVAAALLVHLGVFALIARQTDQREITLTSTPPAAVRVTMVAAPPIEAPAEIVPIPPAPPVLTTETADRTVAQPPKPVEQPKPIPKPVVKPAPKPKPVAKPPVPQPVADTKPVELPTPAKPAVAAPAPSVSNEKLMDLPSAGPKDVQTVGCRVPAPEYPRQARRLKIEGSVLVRLQIDTRGQVESASIARSSGNEELDEAARRTVMSASCSPYMENGRAIAVRAVQPVSFRLSR